MSNESSFFPLTRMSSDFFLDLSFQIIFNWRNGLVLKEKNDSIEGKFTRSSRKSRFYSPVKGDTICDTLHPFLFLSPQSSYIRTFSRLSHKTMDFRWTVEWLAVEPLNGSYTMFRLKILRLNEKEGTKNQDLSHLLNKKQSTTLVPSSWLNPFNS